MLAFPVERKRKMKYYSMIIYTQDGEEAARFVKLRAPELMRKVDAAIEVGAYAVVDAAEEQAPEDLLLHVEP